MRNGFICIITIVLICVSCVRISGEFPESVINVLQEAGKNRLELEKVLVYYKDDSLKYKAACFLIENMIDKYSIMPLDSSDKYEMFLLDICKLNEIRPWEPSISVVGKKLDSIAAIQKPRYRIVKDIDVITADYLISNINQAFEAWYRFKEHRKYSFEIFCEYVLPYRLENEPLNNWRETIYKKFGHLLDSISDAHGIAQQIIENGVIRYNAGMSKYPYPLPLDALLHIGWGDCEHMSYSLTAILRAIGIPSAIECTPTWANRNSGHQWIAVIDTIGNTIDIGFDPGGRNVFLYKLSKIYRHTFSINYENISISGKNQYFHHPEWKDVTCEYGMLTSDIVLETDLEAQSAYLCTFDNFTWIPIVKGIINGKKICFPKIGRGIFRKEQMRAYQDEGKGIVYLSVIEKQERIEPLGYPFILYENGDTVVLKPENKHLQSIKIFRKYPKYEHITDYEQMVKGGRFEASHHRDFSQKKVLYVISEIPRRIITDVYLSIKESYRYVRYVAPDSTYANISEISFYSTAGKLQGKPFSSSINGNGLDPKLAFDGNIDTYFFTENISGAYVGLDLGCPERIVKIIYSPRTDNNDILPGDDYELFYWENGWQSLGRQIADRFYLEYHAVPSNALYLLRNHTNGKEQRIFTYNKGKQVWW